MRKVILYIAVSLDHYIARKNGAVDWLENAVEHIKDEDYGYKAFYDGIDTTLMGRKTFDEILGFDVPFPYPDKSNYVFTSNNEFEHEYAQGIKENASAFLQQLKQEAGKDIWLVGGGRLITDFAENGLIDEMILTVFPILLGEGIPLFLPFQNGSSYTLKENKSYTNGIVQLHYQKKTS